MEVTDRFAQLFAGLDRAFGKYVLADDVIATASGKVRGRGVTVQDDLTPERYVDHLNGGDMLGVVPIVDGNLCSFAAIDIDDYQLNIPDVLGKVKELQLPLVATRSKSGGLHLWLFFADPIPAKAAMQKGEELAAGLGFPGVEVFPKQYQIGPEDVGNWINLPFWNALGDGTDRYGWNDDGDELRDLAAWLDYAESKRITLKQLNRVKLEPAQGAPGIFEDGPPCLQTLASRGIGEGMRNTVMFNIGVYAHSRSEEDDAAAEFMHEANRNYFDPRMDDHEVERIILQVRDSSYRYTCRQAPLKDVCNRPLCLTREHGVRLTGTTYSFGTLWQHVPVTTQGDAVQREQSDECTWQLQINFENEQHILTLNTDQLRSYPAIRKMANNRRLVLPAMDANEWGDLIDEKIPHAEVVHVAEELSEVGQLRTLLSRFLNIFTVGTEYKVEILHGKAWHDTSRDTYVFRGELLQAWLKQNRFTHYDPAHLSILLKQEFGLRVYGTRIGDQSKVNVWSLPSWVRVQKETTVRQGFRQVF